MQRGVLRMIKLDASEQKVAALLLNVTNELAIEYPNLPKVTLRVAGGWVRDKLLNQDSDDLDIALDKMNGVEFASHVNEYFKRHGKREHKLAKIESNPDRSKHLETATMKILNRQIDFVNLRTETYHSNSRVPNIEFGSPLEDATRRDITINSLFYNLHTQTVEDFTQKGLSDLSAHLIRTPLPPSETFFDDPLRIIRVIRFASRFGYRINEDILEATKRNDVRLAFSEKLSKERVGIDIVKSLKGPDPLRSIVLLHEFGFFNLVFEPPKSVPLKECVDSIKSLYAVQWLIQSPYYKKFMPSFSDSSPLTISENKYLYLASILSIYDGTYLDPKNKPVAISKYIILNSLKLSMADADNTTSLILFAKEFHQAADEYQSSPSTLTRVKLGNLIRKAGLSVLKDSWGMVMILAAALEIKELIPIDEIINSKCSKMKVDLTRDYWVHLSESDEIVRILNKYTNLMQYIKNEKLDSVYLWRPLLDGKQLTQLLEIRPGPHVGAILEEIINWQLSQPTEIFSITHNQVTTPTKLSTSGSDEEDEGDKVVVKKSRCEVISLTPTDLALKECREFVLEKFKDYKEEFPVIVKKKGKK